MSRSASLPLHYHFHPLSKSHTVSDTMASVRSFPSIKEIRTFVIGGVGSGGDYHNVKGGHW